MRSMTGYAKTSFSLNNMIINIEIKSYNSKNLELTIKSPPSLSYLELNIKKLISEYVSRGKIYFIVQIEDDKDSTVDLDETKLKEGIQILEKIKSIIGSEEKLNISDILRLRFIFKEVPMILEEELLNTVFYPQIRTLLSAFNRSRETEAVSLKNDIEMRVNIINGNLGDIKANSIELKEKTRENIKEKVFELFENSRMSTEIDENRLSQEIMYYILKSDIEEEIIRMSSHLDNLIEHINLDKPAGKAIMFILQEIQREANTICAKTSDITIKNNSINIKVETERIKEQVFNIE